MKKRKIAFLCSAGGAPAIEAIKAFADYIDFILITDRDCPAETSMRHLGIKVIRHDEKERQELSNKIYETCKKEGVHDLICLFSRLLVEPLISQMNCYNIHPSYLPKYPGMGAEKKAFENRDIDVGATFHIIDKGVDTGKILFQASLSLTPGVDFAQYQKAFYKCKTRVLFLFIKDLLIQNSEHAIISLGVEAIEGLVDSAYNSFVERAE